MVDILQLKLMEHYGHGERTVIREEQELINVAMFSSPTQILVLKGSSGSGLWCCV